MASASRSLLHRAASVGLGSVPARALSLSVGRVLPVVTYPADVLRRVCERVHKEDIQPDAHAVGAAAPDEAAESASSGSSAPPLASTTLSAGAAPGSPPSPPGPPALAPWLQELVEAMLATVEFQDGLGLAAPQVGSTARVFVMRRPKKLAAGASGEFEVCINPEMSAGDKERVGPEACLSVPDYVAFVRRAHSISARWTDETGRRRKETLTGLPAVVFQHELDHLDGVLLLDREVPGLVGTAAAKEAERRYDEDLRRFYPEARARRRGSLDKEAVDAV